MLAFTDLTGKRFGRWTVIKLAYHGKAYDARRRKRRIIHWRCRCDCGIELAVNGANLQRGLTRSCGCLRRDTTRRLSTKHGHATRKNYTGVYSCWAAMLSRCYDRNQRSYRNYGGRGIKVCKRWLKFENFLADMGPRPSGLTLDRINNDGNYKPSNCRWATWSEQVKNRRYLGRSLSRRPGQ